MAVLTPSLAALRAEFNTRAPRRDKSSDGWIGDSAHAGSVSDHNPDETGRVPIHDADRANEVHAIDVDEDLRASDGRGPFTMMRAVRALVEDHRAGRENRLRYVIYERTIWSASWGWTARRYTGANAHDHHAHFSGSYDSARERDTRRWNIGYVEDDMTPAQLKAAVVEALETIRPYAATGPRERLAEAGWDKVSLRAELDYVFEAVLSLGRTLATVLDVEEKILSALGESGELTVEQKAGLLRRALGADAAAIGRALADQN